MTNVMSQLENDKCFSFLILLFTDGASSCDEYAPRHKAPAARLTRCRSLPLPMGFSHASSIGCIQLSLRAGHGHRRLTILDLSDRELPPMSSAGDANRIDFNGRISDSSLALV